MKQTEINILFNSFSAANTKGLLTSIQEQLRAFPSAAYSVIVNIIFNGSANDLENINELIYRYGANANLVNSDSILSLEKKYQGFINEANCLLNTESIQRGRIQQQIYIIENYSRFKNTIVWQVDDDMLFNSCNIVSNKLVLNNSLDFFGIVVQLYENQKNLVDAFVAKSNYTPPVPALLYTLNQLTDILINKFKSKDVEYSEDYHDYYFSSIDEGYYNIKLHENENLPSLIKRILNGQPITRPVLHKQINEVGNEPCFLRGGNFIVFNTEMFLNIPHLGFVLNDHEPARRSDMLHSTLAIDMGYSIVENHQLVLVHNRSFAEYSFEKNISDYYNDVIGSLILIRIHKGVDEINSRLAFHKVHLKKILKLLDEYNLKKEYEHEYNSLIQLSEHINRLNWKELEPKFELFLRKYNRIKSHHKHANCNHRLKYA